MVSVHATGDKVLTDFRGERIILYADGECFAKEMVSLGRELRQASIREKIARKKSRWNGMREPSSLALLLEFKQFLSCPAEGKLA